MQKNDTARIQPTDLVEALGLLTRLPVSSDGARGIKAAWAWPLAGVILAFLAGILAWVCVWVGLTPGTTAAIVLAAMVIMTGAMHEDGLADCADGFWGGYDPERRLEIMKDSRIGAYGVIALTLSLLVRWSAIASLVSAGWIIAPLVAVAALSRVPMIGLMHTMPAARDNGLSVSTGKPDQDTLILGGVIAMLVALLFAGFSSILLAILILVAAFAVAQIARNKIGGQTGDVLGATQQLSEVLGLIAMAALVA